MSDFQTFKQGENGQVLHDVSNSYYSEDAPASCFLVCNGPTLKDLDMDALRQPGIMTAGVNNGLAAWRPDFLFSVDGPPRMFASGWKDARVQSWCGTGKGDDPIRDEDKWVADGSPFPPIDEIYKEVLAEHPEWAHKRNTPDKPKMTGEGKKEAEERVKRWHSTYHSSTRVKDCSNVIFAKLDTDFKAYDFWDRPTFNFGNHKDSGGGRTVMLFALKALWVMGFRRIYIVGCDWFMSPQYAYGFDEQRTERASHNNNTTFGRTTSLFVQMHAHMPEDLQIFNCNERSFLFTFPYMDFNEAVARARSSLPQKEESRGRYVPGN